MTTNLFNVEDRIVLITGSSRGIGLSLAKGFAEAGLAVTARINLPEEHKIKERYQIGPLFSYAIEKDRLVSHYFAQRF